MFSKYNPRCCCLLGYEVRGWREPLHAWCHTGAHAWCAHSMRQPVTAKKALRQLPWLHRAAIMQPEFSFLCSLVKPSTTVKYNKEQLTSKESPLLHGHRRPSWRGCLIKTASYFCPTPLPLFEYNPQLHCVWWWWTYGPHTGFYDPAWDNLWMPTPEHPEEAAVTSSCTAFSLWNEVMLKY